MYTFLQHTLLYVRLCVCHTCDSYKNGWR